jgi:hypothetical protein
MADQTVSIVDNSRERVALDLVRLIQYHDSTIKSTRQGILELYAECRSVVYGSKPKPE